LVGKPPSVSDFKESEKLVAPFARSLITYGKKTTLESRVAFFEIRT